MNVILIGLGLIATKYVKGLKQANISVCGLVDQNDSPEARRYFLSVPFYQDLNDAPLEGIDAVIISTPPKTHYHLIKQALNLNLNVLVEKPGFLNSEEMNELLEISLKRKLKLMTMLHWMYAKENIFVANYIKDLNQIKRIDIYIHEPYAYQKDIESQYIHMGGPYLDGHVNILSFLSLFLDLNKLMLADKFERLSSSYQQIVQSQLIYLYQGIEININYDWTLNKKTKISKIELKDGSTIIVNHSLQQVDHHVTIFKQFEMDRLTSHYRQLFSHIFRNYNQDKTIIIHKKLFEIL